MAEIKLEDLVQNGVIEAPLKVSKNMQELIRVLDEYRTKADKIIATQGATSKSLITLGEKTKDIIKLNEDFAKVQDKVNKELKEGNDYTEKFTKGLKFFGVEQAELIEKSKVLYEKFSALAKNPWVLGLTALIGTLSLLAKATELFYEKTGDGEKILKVQKASWQAFGDTVQGVLIKTGRAVSESLGESEAKLTLLQRAYIGFLQTVAPALAVQSLVAASIYQGIIKEQISLNGELRIAEVQRAQDEAKAAEFIINSKNKEKFSDEERLALSREASKLRKDYFTEDIRLETEQLALMNKRIDAENFLSGTVQRTKEQKDQIKEQEIKIANLQQSSFTTERRNAANTIALVLEIAKAKRDASNTIVDEDFKSKTQLLQNEINLNAAIIANDKATFDSKIKASEDNIGLQLQLQQTNLKEELSKLARAQEEKLLQVHKGSELEALIVEGGHKAVLNEYAKYNIAVDQITAKGYQEQHTIQLQSNQFYIDEEKKQITRRIELEKRAIDAETAARKREFDYAIILIKQQVIDGQKTKAEGDRELFFMAQRTAADLIQIEIDRVKKERAILNISLKDQIALDKELYKLQLDLNNALYEATDDNLQRLEGRVGRLLNDYDKIAQSTIDLTSNLTAARIQNLDLEKKAAEDFYDHEITLAGDNDRAKQKIEKDRKVREEQLAKERLDLVRKEAIIEKAAAVFKAGLEEALLIIKALRDPFFTASAVAGGIELAAVIAKPIPKFAHGTTNAPEGFAIVNDGGGKELIQEPGGNMKMYDTEGPALAYLTAGSKVFTAEETDQIIQAGLRNSGDTRLPSKEPRDNKVLFELMGLRKDIRSKKTVEFNVSREGVEMMWKTETTRRKFLDDFYA